MTKILLKNKNNSFIHFPFSSYSLWFINVSNYQILIQIRFDNKIYRLASIMLQHKKNAINQHIFILLIMTFINLL